MHYITTWEKLIHFQSITIRPFLCLVRQETPLYIKIWNMQVRTDSPRWTVKLRHTDLVHWRGWLYEKNWFTFALLRYSKNKGGIKKLYFSLHNDSKTYWSIHKLQVKQIYPFIISLNPREYFCNCDVLIDSNPNIFIQYRSGAKKLCLNLVSSQLMAHLWFT